MEQFYRFFQEIIISVIFALYRRYAHFLKGGHMQERPIFPKIYFLLSLSGGHLLISDRLSNLAGQGPDRDSPIADFYQDNSHDPKTDEDENNEEVRMVQQAAYPEGRNMRSAVRQCAFAGCRPCRGAGGQGQL